MTTDVCQIQFQIFHDIDPSVYFYYRLTNFYQNHRRYVKSLDTDQLLGRNVTSDTIDSGNCDPLRLKPDEPGMPRKPFYPCGLIANSFFNDTFDLSQVAGDGEYKMTNVGISWDSDKKLYGKYGYPEDQIAPPPNWAPRWGDAGYTKDNPPPDISLYEEFQVWMRTAGLPAFSKLALRNDKDTMKQGRYQVDINLSTHIESTYLWWLLIRNRFQCHRVRRYKGDCNINWNSNGWEEPIPWNCLCGRWWSLRPPWCLVHRGASH